MTGEERNALRLKTLRDLYDFHFENPGRMAGIPRDELQADKEKLLALEYLDGKNLIEFRPVTTASYSAKITSYGIDLIETGRPLR